MRRQRCVRWGGGIALMTGLAALTAGCATNPATGRTQLMLITEQQEIEMGRQADKEVGQSMGLYEDPELQAYVQRLGAQLGRSSERPELPWSFRVIDDPVVNAFALPGGYIYVTRGILGHLGSEAQLITVLGHEIGHVTARHSASQISKQQLAGIGLGVSMAVEPGLAAFSDLLGMGAGLLFLKFSRDDERQADDLGLRYGLQNGYDLREAPEVFVTLRRVSELAEAGRIPGWLSTHPEPENRIQRLEERLAAQEQEFSAARIGREDYFRRLDGIVFGENPREGYFDNSTFLHPDLRFRLDFPAEWQLRNQKHQVIAVAVEDEENASWDAAIVLSLTDKSDPRAAAAEFARESGVEAGRTQSGRFNGLPATWLSFETQSGKGRAAWVLHADRTYQLLGFAKSDKWGEYSSAIDRSLRSFAELRDRAALAVQPARLEIVELPRDMSLEEFQERYPSTISLEALAVANQVQPGARLKRGQLVKRVAGGVQGSR